MVYMAHWLNGGVLMSAPESKQIITLALESKPKPEAKHTERPITAEHAHQYNPGYE